MSAASGRANTYSFWTANGATTTDVGGSIAPVAAKVVFITSLNQIEIQFTNLELDISKETQAIASIDFLVQGFTGLQPTAIALKNDIVADPNLGYVTTLSGGGGGKNAPPITSVISPIATAPTDAWKIATTTQLYSGGIQISSLLGSRPDYLVIAQGPYSGTNSALVGASPYLGTDINDHISFVLSFGLNSGITSASAISTAPGSAPTIDFGTTLITGQEVLLTDQPEPETLTMLTFGFGLLLLIGIVRTRLTAGAKRSADTAA